MWETPLALTVLLRVCQVKISWLVQTIAGGCIKHISQTHFIHTNRFKTFDDNFHYKTGRTTNNQPADFRLNCFLITWEERPPYTLCMPRLYKYIVLISLHLQHPRQVKKVINGQTPMPIQK